MLQSDVMHCARSIIIDIDIEKDENLEMPIAEIATCTASNM